MTCEEVVKDEWEEGLVTSSEHLQVTCLDKCRTSLEAWNKHEFSHVGRKIADLQSQLEWLELQPSSPEFIQALRSTRIDQNCWLEKEDTMWHQRSKICWFQAGDRKMSLFHAKTSTRQKRNFIGGLLDATGVWQEVEGRIEEVVVEYYTNLFTSSNPTDFSQLLQAVQPKVTLAMNQVLVRDFTANEYRMALKTMYPLKALGPNGMPPLFFQHFWTTSGVVITKMVLNFLNLDISPLKFNETYIVLNPKIKEPKESI